MIRCIGMFLMFVAVSIGLQTSTSSAADHKIPDWDPICSGTYNLCGFFEPHGGKERLPQKYERALNFCEGLAGVRVDGRYGYIDTSGQMVISPKFDLVGDFRNGHAEVLVDGKAGIIDAAGHFVLQPQYGRAIPFARNAALVQAGKWVSPYVTEYGRLDTFSLPSSNEPFALIDLASGKIVKDNLSIREFDFDIYVWAAQRGGNGYGLLAPDGSWKVAPHYMDATNLSEGRSIVCTYVPYDSRGDTRAARCGALDENGEEALSIQPIWIVGYWNGLYRVVDDRKVGLLSEKGALLGDRFFDNIDTGLSGDVMSVLMDGRWVGLTRQGKIVPNPNDGKVLLACPSGLKFVSKSGGIDVVAKDGKPTIPYRLDGGWLGKSCEFPMTISVEHKYGFLNAQGKLISTPPFFDNSYSFNDDYVGVNYQGKWGILDKIGNFTVRPKFKELVPDDGAFRVTDDGKEFWIDAHGRPVPEPYRSASRREVLQCRDGGAKIISRENEGETYWGLADGQGQIVIQPKYRAISCFENGLAWVPMDEKKAWCPIDRWEKMRADIPCVTNYIASRIFDAGPEKMSDDDYESGVLWMRANLEYGAGLRKQAPRIVGNLGTSF